MNKPLPIGDCVVRRIHDPATGADRVEVLKADDRIAITRDLLMAKNDPRWFRVRGDGDEVTICGEYVYRATGELTADSHPVYALDPKPASVPHVPTPTQGEQP